MSILEATADELAAAKKAFDALPGNLFGCLEIEYQSVDDALRGIDRAIISEIDKKLNAVYGSADGIGVGVATEVLFHQWFIRAAAKVFRHAYGIPLVPVNASTQACMKQYSQGDREVIFATLDGLGIIDEEHTSWEQVLEIRKDIKARHACRTLIHWLDKEMIGKEKRYIEDEIAIKIEQYEWALRKHGVSTVLGSITKAIDGKFMLGTSAITGSALLSGYPDLAMLALSGLVVGNVAIRVSQALLDFADFERGHNSEIAWVYQIKKKLKGKGSGA